MRNPTVVWTVVVWAVVCAVSVCVDVLPGAGGADECELPHPAPSVARTPSRRRRRMEASLPRRAPRPCRVSTLWRMDDRARPLLETDLGPDPPRPFQEW